MTPRGRGTRNKSGAALCTAIAAFGVFGVTGCASSTHLYVKSTNATNDGGTLYMMVRSVDGKTTTVSEQYQDAASKLFADPPDPTVVVGQPIFPGNPVSVTLNEPDTKQVVLYFFYTKPLTNWRVPLPRPLPSEIYVDLGPNQIEHVQVRKR
jgi:hypothetical protein